MQRGGRLRHGDGRESPGVVPPEHRVGEQLAALDEARGGRIGWLYVVDHRTGDGAVGSRFAPGEVTIRGGRGARYQVDQDMARALVHGDQKLRVAELVRGVEAEGPGGLGDAAVARGTERPWWQGDRGKSH